VDLRPRLPIALTSHKVYIQAVGDQIRSAHSEFGLHPFGNGFLIGICIMTEAFRILEGNEMFRATIHTQGPWDPQFW
jgi:hypothetical protein